MNSHEYKIEMNRQNIKKRKHITNYSDVSIKTLS
jgi:hypothetical protein